MFVLGMNGTCKTWNGEQGIMLCIDLFNRTMDVNGGGQVKWQMYVFSILLLKSDRALGKHGPRLH